MNSLLDNSDEDEEDHSQPHGRGGDREITLGTTMILLIFFALAVYGAALFGFGYSLGSKHTANLAAAPQAAPVTSASFNGFKPAAGSPLGGAPADKAPVLDSSLVKTVTLPAAAAAASSRATPEPAETEAPAPVAPKPPLPAISTALVSPATAAPVAGAGSVVVQVAAVSHEEDAEMIATTLRRRGYLVNIRTEADRLLHVQVGPFPTKKDAEAMRAKLLADGFNAYIK